jgi:hypothetical protein
VYLRVFVRDVRLYLLLRLLLSSFRLHTDRPQNVSLLHNWKNMESRMTIDVMTTTTSMILMTTAAMSTTTKTTMMRMNAAAAAADNDCSQTSERDRRGIEPGDFGDA